MARGFESKAIANQQESAREAKSAREEDGEAGVQLKRRRLELARADVLGRLESARAEAHKEMLRRALEAVEKELARLR